MSVPYAPQGIGRLWRAAFKPVLVGLVVLAPFAGASRRARAAQIGDRLVLAVNGVPYTQRQVEMYINIKESLRRTNDGNVRVIDAHNWSDALAVFAEDMTLLQEAQRLGSFNAQGQMLDRFSAAVQQKVAHGGALKQALVRLGVDNQTLERTLDRVLRVAAFRRSKDRQEAQARTPHTGKASWLTELEERAVVRHYEGANSYVAIEPTQAQAQAQAQAQGGTGNGR